MRKFSILLKQMYFQKLRSKSFILMTLLYITIISAFMFWSNIKAIFVNDETTEVALVNETTVELNSIFTSNDDVNFTISQNSIESLNEDLKNQKVDAVLILSDENNVLNAEIVTFNPLKLNDQSTISSFIQYAGKIYEVGKLNLTAKEADQILNSTPNIMMTNLNKTVADGKSEDEKQAGIWISYLAGIVIYFFIMTFLSMITTDVANEKGSRALEMLLVSVKPSTHLQSKIVGVFLLALTQIGILFVVIIAYTALIDGGAKWALVQSILQDLSIPYILYVFGFLFLTIFLYLIIGALFGSLVSKPEVYLIS